MTAPCSPPWARPPRRGYRQSTGDLRVSAAERTEVADHLSKHYADGRLDQPEFNERLDRAMSAKTQSDLGGLVNDLPPLDGAGGAVARRSRDRRRHNHSLLFIILFVAVAASVGHSLVTFHLPWLLLGALVAFWLLRTELSHWRR